MGKGIVVLGALSLTSLPAMAAHEALDPLNRGHVGISFSDENTPGVNAGLDSRLTRVVFIDVGIFASPMSFPETEVSSEKTADFVFLRHGVYVAPGLRLP